MNHLQLDAPAALIAEPRGTKATARAVSSMSLRPAGRSLPPGGAW